MFMKTKKVFLLLNGEKPKKLPNSSSYDLVCATDGAYQYLKENNIKPDFISGDFDSLEDIPTNIEAIHTPNQDFTDFEKILHILYQKKYNSIDVFASSGKEQDHFLGNLHTAILWKEKLKITFFDDFGIYFFGRNELTLSNCFEKTISLIPFPKATRVTTKGLLYPLKNQDLTFGVKIGTRNKAVEEEVKIRFEIGELLIFINH